MTKRVVAWFINNTAFALLAWFGVVQGVSGAVNVLRVWVGIECVLVLLCVFGLSATNAKEVPYPYSPKWMGTVRPWIQGAFIALFAWFGFFGLAICYAIACVCWAMVKERIARAQGITP